jgi:hypothetical protein
MAEIAYPVVLIIAFLVVALVLRQWGTRTRGC